MRVLASLFVSSVEDDLDVISGLPIQLAFYKRAVFCNFDHDTFNKRLVLLNIKVESVHAPAADVYHTHGDEFINMLETIKNKYGVTVITVHPQRGERRQAKSQYKKIEQRIKDLEIIIAYETFETVHEERKWITQVEDMHTYFDALKFPFLGVTYDFTHSESKRNLLEIRHFNSRIHVVHFSDARSDMLLDSNEKHQHLGLGFGNYPVLEFIDTLIKIEYNGFLVIEYLPRFHHYLKKDVVLISRYINGDRQPFLDEYRRRQKGD